jgi:hypothetical protein
MVANQLSGRSSGTTVGTLLKYVLQGLAHKNGRRVSASAKTIPKHKKRRRRMSSQSSSYMPAQQPAAATTSVPVLLYNNYCPHSHNVMKSTMSPRGELMVSQDKVRCVCVDDMLDKISPYIDRTPALLVSTVSGLRAVFGSELRARLCALVQTIAGGSMDPEAVQAISFHGLSGIEDTNATCDGVGTMGGFGGSTADAAVPTYASATEDIHIYCPEDGGGGSSSSVSSAHTDKFQVEVDTMLSKRTSDIASMFGGHNKAAAASGMDSHHVISSRG